MIQINLLPGANRKGRGRSAGAPIGARLAALSGRIRDPFLIAATASVVLCGGALAAMFLTQSRRDTGLQERVEVAAADSARYATVIAAKRRAESRRDSVERQLGVIKAIDDNRFVWPHVLDEVSRALPPYTWLTVVSQTSDTPVPAASVPDSIAAKADSAQGDAAPPPPEPLKFRVEGNTVDIQALTRFMKLLESSPFVRNVTLAKSDLVQVEGKDVTAFQLDCEYEVPAGAAVRTAPLTLLVR